MSTDRQSRRCRQRQFRRRHELRYDSLRRIIDRFLAVLRNTIVARRSPLKMNGSVILVQSTSSWVSGDATCVHHHQGLTIQSTMTSIGRTCSPSTCVVCTRSIRRKIPKNSRRRSHPAHHQEEDHLSLRPIPTPQVLPMSKSWRSRSVVTASYVGRQRFLVVSSVPAHFLDQTAGKSVLSMLVATWSVIERTVLPVSTSTIGELIHHCEITY